MDGVPVAIKDFKAIFRPSNGWCWYTAGGTLNGNACICKCCHVITNSQGNGTSVLSLYRLWNGRDVKLRFRGFFE